MTENNEKKDFSERLEEQIKEEKKFIKEHPYKATISILWSIIWYAILAFCVMLIITRPYECEYKGKNYNVFEMQEMINEGNRDYNNPLIIEKPKEPICNYKISRWIEPIKKPVHE